MPALRRSTALALLTAGTLAVGAIGYGGIELATAPATSRTSSAVAGSVSGSTVLWGGRRGAAPGHEDSTGQDGYAQGIGGTDTATATGSTAEATSSQLRGVVDIVTTVNYGQAEAAGTGIVLTSGGEVLTNNHVIEGATSITVTVLSTGTSYRATVVGTSATNDIAVLQLSGATGLTTAPIGDSSDVQVGDSVTGVGNAGNDPGTSASTGTVTALDQEVTASDGTGDSETVSGLIQTSAPIRSGDSGGPLLDADGSVVGIDTAARTDARGETVAAYAIPIDHALDIATQILAGVDDDTIQQGVPAFLGVQTSASGGYASGGYAAGVTIAGVVDGSAADAAGLVAGDTITVVDGSTVSSADDLTSVLATHDPGDRVSVSWVDADGSSHTATITLGAGPAA